MHFINENYINSLLDDENLLNEELQLDLIQKGLESRGLTLKESTALLNINNPELIEKLFNAARAVKEKIYGSRLVLFAPLYVSNNCANNCLFCTYRRDNKQIEKKTLTLNEIESEAEFLIKQGHKSLMLVYGEQPKKSGLRFIGEAMARISKLSYNGSGIRKININTAPLDIDSFKLLKSFKPGTYHYFQETYHYATYKLMHKNDPKNNYEWNLFTMDRALQAGIDNVGLGALFGLTDYKFETLALLSHAFDLDFKYGIGPRTISIPRLEPVFIAPSDSNPPHAVDDLSFKKLAAVIRLALPYTGIILSARESIKLRNELINVGVSQISTGKRAAAQENETQLEHQMKDNRSLDELVKEISSSGFIPSFCTGCYKTDRSGDTFMKLAKSGEIGNICLLNAVSTYREYLNNFASPGTKSAGNDFWENDIKSFQKPVREKIKEILELVDRGDREVYF